MTLTPHAWVGDNSHEALNSLSHNPSLPFIRVSTEGTHHYYAIMRIDGDSVELQPCRVRDHAKLCIEGPRVICPMHNIKASR